VTVTVQIPGLEEFAKAAHHLVIAGSNRLKAASEKEVQSDQLRIESWKRNEKARIELERFQATVEKVRSELVPPKDRKRRASSSASSSSGEKKKKKKKKAEAPPEKPGPRPGGAGRGGGRGRGGGAGGLVSAK